MLVEYDVSQLYKKSPLGNRFRKRVLVPKNAVDVWKVSRNGENNLAYVWTGPQQNTFLYISLPSPHDYDMKLPNFTFYVGRQQATTKISFSF